ncbi:LysM peptidoglycan-binding domain-containing protein [Phytoactinopolyspora endophytica]|uniref:LysM peptidoglycan-binding domain-containing protein n=1 Tax=Phytoactinopolyspora endophytica TaxID=1642495 RepID=UPI00101DA0AE|nr:LysM peptidoglycan-binding domain-containing protein [Phytoactinopolyspora endophytica]
MLITSTRPMGEPEAPVRGEGEAPERGRRRRVGSGTGAHSMPAGSGSDGTDLAAGADVLPFARPRRAGRRDAVSGLHADGGLAGATVGGRGHIVRSESGTLARTEQASRDGSGEAGIVVPVRPGSERLVRRQAVDAGTRPRRLMVPGSDNAQPRRCATSAPPSMHGSRLTARGRLVVAVLWLVLIALAAVPFLRAGGGADANVETVPVEVEAGDTLWQLAHEVDPGADPRAVVDAIIDLNGLRSGGDIRPGDTLMVPAAQR